MAWILLHFKAKLNRHTMALIYYFMLAIKFNIINIFWPLYNYFIYTAEQYIYIYPYNIIKNPFSQPIFKSHIKQDHILVLKISS